MASSEDDWWADIERQCHPATLLQRCSDIVFQIVTQQLGASDYSTVLQAFTVRCAVCGCHKQGSIPERIASAVFNPRESGCACFHVVSVL